MDDVDSFVAHLEAIYELATFHGDETLQQLLLHSKRLKEDIEEFKQNSILEVEEEKKELIEYEEGEEETRA
jgi:chloramphenicol O-acetyltransferase